MAKINLKSLRGKKLIVAAIASLCVLGGIGYGLYSFYAAPNPQKEQLSENQKLLNEISSGRHPLNNGETRRKLEAALLTASNNEKLQINQLLANEYLATGEHAKAAESLKKAESPGGGSHPDLLFSIAAAYEQAGNKAEALVYYKKTAQRLRESDDIVRNKNDFLSLTIAKIDELER